MSLQQALDAFKANFQGGGPPYYAPPWIHEILHRATDELVASGAASRALKAGAFMPDFELLDVYGTKVASGALLAAGPLVISFYLGLWCPYCSLELQALEASLGEIQRRGANLVAISPQTRASSHRAVRENKLSFPILLDPHNTVAAEFGLRVKLPDHLIDVYKNVFKADLAMTNADGSCTLPMPARFVVCQDGAVIYTEVNPDYTHRRDPRECLAALDTA